MRGRLGTGTEGVVGQEHGFPILPPALRQYACAPGDQFLLDPDVVFLNHGSFGACPRPVFEAYQRWQRELEREPVEFLARRGTDCLRRRARHWREYVGARADDLVFVTNAMTGMNRRSLAPARARRTRC